MTMRLNILTFLTILILSIAHTAKGETINIEMKDEVTLPEKQIVLGDIAYVSCNNPSLSEKVNNIFIGNTPWPGNIRKIEKDILYARLLDEGIDPGMVNFGSSTSSMISVESITITGEEIMRVAKEYLMSTLSRPESEVVIESDRPPRDKILPACEGDVRMDVSQIDPNKNWGNVQLIVRIFIGNKQYLKIPVFFNIRTYEDIVTSVRKISRSDILKAEDLELRRMETTNLCGSMYYSINDLIGKRAIRTLQPNTPITAESVDNPPVIKKGDLVRVFIQTGNLHVVMKGVAKEDGYIGKIIRVNNVDSKKELYGKVEDSATVKITL